MLGEASTRSLSVADLRAVKGFSMDVDEHGHPIAPLARDYRTISVTRDGGIAEIRALIALSDEDAIAQAAETVRDLAMDLWDGLRFVEHFAGRVAATGRGLTPVSALGGP